MADQDKERYRRVRGLILKSLAFGHPKAVDATVLHSTLDNVGYTVTREEMDSHVAYLEDETKGYVRTETRKGPGFDIVMILITPRGLDLLDRFTPKRDPGVDVRF